MQSERQQKEVDAGQVFVLKTSAIHGTGAFAKQLIGRDERVVEYRGEKISRTESMRRCAENNQYIFRLSDEYDLDGDVEWNPGRFLNHSCQPNCEAFLEDGGIWIVALRDVSAGEELTFNYGFDLEDYRNYPCNCGAPGCVGFIVAEEFFEHVRRQALMAKSASQ
jgi:SET domain-containing protein